MMNRPETLLGSSNLRRYIKALMWKSIKKSNKDLKETVKSTGRSCGGCGEEESECDTKLTACAKQGPIVYVCLLLVYRCSRTQSAFSLSGLATRSLNVCS